MKKVLSYTLAVLFVGSFLFLGNSHQHPAKADTSPVPNPSIIGFIPDVGAVQDVVISPDGTKAYLASNPFGLVTLDISNIQSPKVLGSQRPSVGPAGHLAISSDGKTAVLVGTPRGTDIVDVSNPTLPKVLASVAGTSVDAAISGNYAYIVSQGDVKVVDITQPANPVLVTTLATPGIASGIAISGALGAYQNTALVSDCISGDVIVVNISNPITSSIVGSASLGGLSGKVAITEIGGIKYGLVANTSLGKLQIVDINIPSSPQAKGSISTGSALDVTAVGSTAYVAANGVSMVIVDISDPSNPRQLSSYGNSGQAIALNGDTAFIALNSSLGVSVVNISNPNAPTTITTLSTISSANHLAISSDGKTAVLVGTPRGADIVDISNPEYPKVLASVPGGVADVAISGNYAYIVVAGDIKVVNIINPSSPQVVATLVTPGIASGIAISGTTAVVSDNFAPPGISVVDISNPTAPVIVGSASLTGLPGKVAITTIGGVKYGLVANPSLGQLQIVDINTPSNPQLVGSISTGSALDVTAVGATAYVSANGTFKIVNIANPASPALLGTYDSSNSAFATSISGNIAYVAGTFGVDLVDVLTPTNPRQIVNIPSLGGANDVIVFGNKIYVADNKAELVIMDIYHDGIDVLKTADKYSVKSGDEVTYTLTLKNTSPNTLTNLNFSDVIPTGTTYVSGSASGNGAYSSLAKKIIWTYLSILPNQTITETFKVRVN